MPENSFSTRKLAHPNPPSVPISSVKFRCLFSKKTGTPHPPYPVEPIFCVNNSSNKLNINDLNFLGIYQSVTANRPFCPLFSPKKRYFRPKYSLLTSFRSHFYPSRSNSNPHPES
jgi:hypothetical protein